MDPKTALVAVYGIEEKETLLRYEESKKKIGQRRHEKEKLGKENSGICLEACGVGHNKDFL